MPTPHHGPEGGPQHQGVAQPGPQAAHPQQPGWGQPHGQPQQPWPQGQPQAQPQQPAWPQGQPHAHPQQPGWPQGQQQAHPQQPGWPQGQPHGHPQQPGWPQGQPHAHPQQPGWPQGQPHAQPQQPGWPPQQPGWPQQPPGAYGGQPGWGAPQYTSPVHKPSTAGHTLKIILGVFGVVLLAVMLMQQAHAGYGTSFIVAFFLGGAAWVAAWGIASKAGKKLPLIATVAIPAVVVLLGGAIGPTASHAFWVGEEQDRWDELTAAMEDEYFVAYRWREDYSEYVHDEFQRPQWRAQFFVARINTAARHKDTHELRELVKEIDADSDAEVLAPARKRAAETFAGYYDDAKKRMYAARAAEGEREFPIDDSLRQAFAVVLDDLTTAASGDVYVAFKNDVSLTPPDGTEEVLKLYQSDPEVKAAFPNGAPVISEGPAFSPKYDARRRSTFMTAMGDSFGRVFDADLLTLVALEQGTKRDGELVLEVSSSISRLPKFYLYEKELGTPNPRLAGLMFGIAVEWKFRLIGRDGKVLYDPPPVMTTPASSVRVDAGPNDPDWAMYSVMMDSAYYNYARQITGQFGLTPPAQKTSFGHQAL